MTKYSRTAKYEDLRNKLAQDGEANIESNDLSKFANHLNRISADNFEPMETSGAASHDPIHAKREAYLNGQNSEVREQNSDNELSFTKMTPVIKPTTSRPSEIINKSNNDLSTFDNEYLDEYINEVKQYNVEQGEAFTEDTQNNILRGLRGEKPAPRKPFREDELIDSETADIPFLNSRRPASKVELTPAEQELEFTRDNIAKEVKNLVGNTGSSSSYSFVDNDVELPKVKGVVSSNISSTNGIALQRQLEQEKTAHEKLLNQTNQMRVQLDEYEDDLNDVSDKVQHTNRILNFVLIVLIIALVVVLGIVIYWILLSKGMI